LNIDDNMAVALYSGNMGVKQGLEIVIEAAERLKDEKITFVMCGAGAMYDVLRKRAADLKNIRWLPLQPLERLNDLLNLADVHLLPQRHDAADVVMPSKLTGMLASGKPVLATALPGTGLANVLTNMGAVVPPGCAEQFADSLKSLINDQQLRRSMGIKARAFALEHLDQESVLKRFEKNVMEHLHIPTTLEAVS
jgi:colanic acid biosynthesis glycosyl transferase WcaI